MKKVLAAATAAVLAAAVGVSVAAARSNDTTITGAGSTFVYPLVQSWVQPVGSAFGYSLQYSPIGSGGGIAAITNRTVDFGASDAPLSPDEFAGCKGCAQIPWALSATAVLYNLPGVKNDLHMTGPVLAKIFMGKITSWSDSAIRKLNKGVKLPSTRISIVHRSDNSGTTFNFTDYLSSVSAAWKSKYGKGVSVQWPTGSGGRGSSGVAALVTQTPGAIGYADVAYALKNHLQFFALQNRAGKFTVPGLAQIAAAGASDAKPAADNSLSIVNPPKRYRSAYPISTYTYVIVPLKTAKSQQLKRFLLWALTKGQTYGPRLLFSPIPKTVLTVSEKTVKKIHS